MEGWYSVSDLFSFKSKSLKCQAKFVADDILEFFFYLDIYFIFFFFTVFIVNKS